MICLMGSRRWPISISLMMAALAGSSSASDEDLGSGASALYSKYCQECHSGRSSKGPRFDPSDRDSLVAERDGGSPMVVPGEPEASLLWRKLGIENAMPPRKKPQPSTEEKDLIRRWILQGAPAARVGDDLAASARKPLLERDAMAAMVRFLEGLPEEDRRFQRFFTLTVPYNREILARIGRKPPALPAYRAALSKMLNGLSLERDIVLPRAVDEDKTVYAVDLRELGWDKDREWITLRSAYPMGLTPSDLASKETLDNLKRLAGEDLPSIRGDWFIANASQPPLYYAMLNLPEKLEDLETRLGVNANANFLNAKVARAAFHESGISEQPRLVERHRTREGAYWKSYDFKPANGDDAKNPFRRPLGPTFEGNKHADLAFRHDGGEMIFSLPNGLQGYYLADAKGDRLNKAPSEIVNDLDAIESDNRIVAGISCIACHKEGMKGVNASKGSRGIKDELRENFSRGSEVRKEIERRHPRPDDFAALLERDRKRFVAALREATEPFLEGAKWSDPEVISLVARDYFQKLDIDDIAIELGYVGRDLALTKAEIRTCLKNLGLAEPNVPSVPRREWQAPSGKFRQSAFQMTASMLDLGDPLTYSPSVR